MLARCYRICAPFSALLTVFILGACAGLPRSREGPPPDSRAQELMRAGNLTGAANEYLQLAQTSKPPVSYTYALRAAEAYLAAHRIDEASQLLSRLSIPTQEVNLATWRKILWARLALLENNSTEALTRLDALHGVKVPLWLQRKFYQARADAYSARGDFLKAAQERLLLEPLLTDPEEQKENQQAIWEAVNQLKPATLSHRLPANSGVLRGWMELALIVQSPHLDPEAFRQSLGLWQQRYPDHPATHEILTELIEVGPNLYLEVKKLALLLPLTGKFAEASAAIRDGFLTVWYRDAGNSKRPAVNIYDANTTNIMAVYQKAIEEGADLVIGPLEKPAIETLVKQGALPVPTLVLNQLDALAPPSSWTASQDRFYQFALSPEEEARQVAERAWLDGHLRAAVLMPQSGWGQRVFRAFKQRWETLGGQVLEYRSYINEAQDYPKLVEELLHRAQDRLQVSEASLLAPRSPASEPRKPHTPDFIFLAGFPAQARQIQPELALRTSIPVYSTSHVYTGVTDQQADTNLNGITFGDMPWILDTSSGSASLREAILGNWPEGARAYMRFYAFGIDAYRLIPHLGFLRSLSFARFAGETGSLRIDKYGRIHRQLIWARFVNGRPILLKNGSHQ